VNKMRDAFSDRHPLVNLVFFAAAIGFAMFLMQPVCLAVAAVCSLLTALFYNGRRTAALLKFLLPTAVVIMLVNPLFNHRGATVLTYFPWGNPLTLESVLYGIASAVLIATVALWCMSLSRVMTTDKLVFLFGRVAPSLGLLLSMALRFIPRFTAQFRETMAAQRQVSQGAGKSFFGRVKAGASVFSVMVSRSMENAVDTSDSMKSRGYGLKGRTAFSLFHFYARDAVLLALMLTETAALLALLFSGQLPFRYYPSVRGAIGGAWAIVFYSIYAALLLTPLLLNIGEDVKWKRLRSKI